MSDKLKTYLMISLLALTLTGMTAYSSGTVFAQSKGFEHDILIQKLSERFGIDQNEIEEVMAEIREENCIQRQEWFQERLAAAAASGEITEEQRRLIAQKHEEIRQRWQERWDGNHDINPENRKQASQEKREELAEWAQENGIEVKYFGQGQRAARMNRW